MHVDIVVKTPIFFLSVCLFACFSAPRTGQISLKFYIGRLHENNSTKSNFGENQREIWDILHKVLSSFNFLRRNHPRNIPLFKGSGITFAKLAYGYVNISRELQDMSFTNCLSCAQITRIWNDNLVYLSTQKPQERSIFFSSGHETLNDFI